MQTLHAAAEAGDLGSVRAWIEKKPAAVDARDAGGRTGLHWAALAGREAVARFLVGRGADVRARDGKGLSALDLAVSCGSPRLALFLLASGAEADPPPRCRLTPLHHAARQGYLAVVEELLRRGADVHRRDGERSEYTPLHYAAQEGHAKASKALLAAGAEADARAGGSTPLAVAIGAGHLETVRTLLAHGADPNARSADSGNFTPLHLACTWNQTDRIVRRLLASGANPSLRANDGRTPAATARACGKRAFAKLLEQASGETPGGAAPAKPASDKSGGPAIRVLYEPMSERECLRIDRQRWRRHRISALPEGVSLVPEGRSASYYVRDGAFVIELYAELSGSPRYDALIGGQGFDRRIAVDTLETSSSPPELAAQARRLLDRWLREKKYRYKYSPEPVPS